MDIEKLQPGLSAEIITVVDDSLVVNAPRQAWAKDKPLWSTALPGLHRLPGGHFKKGVFDFYGIELLGIGREIVWW